jgi:hypothetical protein
VLVKKADRLRILKMDAVIEKEEMPVEEVAKNQEDK